MPTICFFYGITIMMYWNDHLPPHFHARYGEFQGIFDFDGNQLKGDVPHKQCILIAAWSLLRRDLLQQNWELAKASKQLVTIDPLT